MYEQLIDTNILQKPILLQGLQKQLNITKTLKSKNKQTKKPIKPYFDL